MLMLASHQAVQIGIVERLHVRSPRKKTLLMQSFQWETTGYTCIQKTKRYILMKFEGTRE